MAKVHIHSGQGAVGTGDLQLQNGAPMDATLRPVTDAANTASPLELSTGLVAVTSTLQIATNDTEYIDAEDGSGNNRFTVSRASGSQVVNVDFASNPTAGTDQVGAIRTYEDGANLSDSVSFLRNGYVGIGTNAPDTALNIVGSNQCNLRVESTVAGGGIDLKDSTTTADNQVGIGAFGDDLCFRSGGAAAGNMRLLANGNLGVGTNNPLYNVQVDSNTDTDVVTTTTSDSYSAILSTFNSGSSSGNFMQIRSYGNATSGTIFGNSISKSNMIWSNSDNLMAIGTIGATPLVLGTSNAEQMRITSAGNVGIGTTTPESKLHVADTVSGGIVSVFVDNNINALNSTAQIKFTVDAGGSLTSGGAAIQAVNVDPNFASTDLVFRNSGNSIGSLSEAMRITGSGTSYLRLSTTTGGIQFNGDTAAANALDDYEEGDWTPEISFDLGTTGITYTSRGGKYTKIGRQVSVSCYVLLSNKGSDVGTARIQGLPYTIGNAAGFYSAASFGALLQITYNGSFQGYGELNTTRIALNDYTEAGVQGDITDADFTNNSQILMQFTYFV